MVSITYTLPDSTSPDSTKYYSRLHTGVTGENSAEFISAAAVHVTDVLPTGSKFGSHV